MSSDHLPRTNRWLILLAFVFCFILGGLFTRSSAGPAPVVAEHENPTPVPSEITAAAVTATPVPDSSSSKTASAKSSSKKSSSGKKTSKTPDGIWVASGSSWMYLVDDKAYHRMADRYRWETLLFRRCRNHADRMDRYRRETLLYGPGRNHADRRHPRLTVKPIISMKTVP